RLRRAHRLMRRAAGPEPVARCAERSVPMRLQDLQDSPLDEAVENRRHAEGANAPCRLGYLDPPHRLRLVGAVKQLSADRRPMLFQMRAQGLDGHAVDPWRALVALHSRQRFPQIVPLDNRFHARSRQRRRALVCGARRIGFGPSGAQAQGFTPRPLAESQFTLDFRPPGQFVNSALLALSTGRAFSRYTGLLCPLLTSPTRSRALRRVQSVFPDAPDTSRGTIDRLPRTPAGFTTPALDDRGLRSHTPARPAG